MRTILRAAGVASCAFAALHLAGPVKAGAQTSCAPASYAFVPDADPSQSALDRKISLRGGTVSLRQALDKVSEAAGIRLSYAADLLPLTRNVCLEYESASVGRVLADILAGSAVRPISIASNQIVLTPVKLSSTPVVPEEKAAIMKQVSQLDRVVVTGSASPSLERSNPVAMDVVTGEQLARRSSTSLSNSLDGVVPGLWIWEQSPLSILARYGSIRGASSFGVSYPKVYVDGIEVANSLLVTHLDPDAVSRIEVIRGPQGAALYGADAISGVMNIVTKQEGAERDGSRAQIRARGGATASDYSPSSVLAQSHAGALRFGDGSKSARFGVTAARMGAFIPDAFSQQVTASGALRMVRSNAVLTSTFRMFAQDSRTPAVPLEILSSSNSADSSDEQSVRQFTLGGSATFVQNDRWTHTALAGVDGYTLQSAAMLDSEFPSPIDSALRAARGSAVRATMKASSVGRFGTREGTSAVVTLSAEHSTVHDMTSLSGASPSEAALMNMSEIRSNTGFVGQVNAGFRDALFVNAGMRVERNTSPVGLGDIAALPTLGVALSHSFGPAAIKLRSAYGKAIRPVQTSTWSGSVMGLRGSIFGSSLSPEKQSGMEFGADAAVGRFLFRATRFDQQASDLVQPVRIMVRARLGAAPVSTHVIYELQNVGDVSNRGWELQGSMTEGPWTLGTTFSQVDSRVESLSSSYGGDLQPGDRMLEVPARTFGVNVGLTQRRWFTSWALSRASDWINYDRLAMLQSASNANVEAPLLGSSLRTYWKKYDGATRLGGRLGFGLAHGMTFTVDGENLFNVQRGEPDNITILPGRTVSAGLSLSF